LKSADIFALEGVHWSLLNGMVVNTHSMRLKGVTG